MNIVEKLDLAIKLKEKGTIEGAYSVLGKNGMRDKETYMTNSEWNAFYNAMSLDARKEYGDGGGDELSEKIGRPPKMASYGSSSRMIYNLSKEKDGFHYEKKLHTTVGGQANLDGFYEDENHYIFVEAKCHEPYTIKKNKVSVCYAELYEYINKHMDGHVQIKMDMSGCGRYKNVQYFAHGEELVRFDMKQMICHLLGIATGIIKGKLKNKQTDFIYLFYDPTDLNISADAKAEIVAIYDRTCYEYNLVDFIELFRMILAFLNEMKFQNVMSCEEVNDIVSKFSIKLESQKSYPSF